MRTRVQLVLEPEEYDTLFDAVHEARLAAQKELEHALDLDKSDGCIEELIQKSGWFHSVCQIELRVCDVEEVK